MATVGVSGKINGEAQWLEFGHDDSRYDANGVKRVKKLAKTANDFKGAR